MMLTKQVHGLGVLLPAGSLLGLQLGAGRGRRGKLHLGLWFLFVLLKCYSDNAAFNQAGGGIHL